jgi:prevent-host-death family protein
MQTFTVSEVKTRFGEFLDIAQREPVQVTRYDRVVGVMVSAEDYAAMQLFYADRLCRTMDETTDAAKKAGITSEILEQLLADES